MISDSAIVKDAKIGENSKVWHYANIYGCQIGKNCNIGSYVEIQNDCNIGDNVTISSHSFICSLVDIENDVFIGHGVKTINDIYPPSKKRTGLSQWKPTLIKKGAVIGSNATLFPVVIGENSVVGAGSVVTKDVPDNAIVAGNPAKIIKFIEKKSKIPLIDLRAQYFSIKKEIDEAIERVISRCNFISGEGVKNFESKFADYCAKKNCVVVDNGTAALFIVLKCLDVKEGDEVIIPVNTFIATAEAVRLTGARPVFIDIEEKSLLIDTDKIEEKITNKTKAIIPVHLYGNVCDMDKIFQISKKHNLLVIEDCAQAHGSKYNGKKAPVGDIGCFSFFPGKNLGAYGDGGAIVCSDDVTANKFRKYINHGRSEKYYHDSDGFNFRMDNLQAAILEVKLKYLDKWLTSKREIAKKYELAFGEIVNRPTNSKQVEHSFHLFVLRSKKRDELKKHLEKNNIESGIHYPVPLHLQPALSYLGYKKGDFPLAEKVAEEILSIPMYAELEEKDVEKIIYQVLDFFKDG